MNLPACKKFATAAAAAVTEIAATLDDDERAALNRHLAEGGRLALAFNVNGKGHSEIHLDVIDFGGEAHHFLTLKASQLRLA